MFAAKEVILKRLDACSKCDKRVVSILGVKCSECGCILKLKARLEAHNCPLGKWDQES